MERLDKPMGDLKKAHFSFETAVMSGKEVLRVDQLSVAYDEASPLFRNVSFDLRRGETVALIGPNGIGKSTMLKCLTGSLRPVSGEIQWGTKVQIGYYDQEQTGLNPSNTVLEELWSAYPGMEEARIRTVLGNFLFSGDDVLKKISALSGGEKARVSLSKLMLKEANMLILDEPTNHLDLFAKEVLEAALMDYEGTLLFISHDRYFLNKMAERIVELHPGGTEHYLGNYDDYVEKKQELEDIAREAAEARLASSKNSAKSDPSLSVTEKSGAASFEADKQAKREERNRQRKQEALEQQIAKLETEITELEAQMALPEIYQDYMKLQELQESAEDHKLQLAKAYEEWEELALE
jgi:ATP-binding cassette subfamily F protein 3